jgi:hypothetical protein
VSFDSRSNSRRWRATICPAGLEIYEEFLDLDRFPDLARRPQLARGFAEKYRRAKPDVIVTEGSRALLFASDRLAGLFTDVPIVYGGAFEPIVDFSSLPANVVGRQQPLALRRPTRSLTPSSRMRNASWS